MRVLVTRPANEAAPWLTALQAAGHDTVALPLIDIQPAADPAAVQAAWQHVPACHAIMFVSAAAVHYFFAAAKASGAVDLAQHLGRTRCWATGQGTRKRLLQAGVPEGLIDSPAADAGQFDSEALWRVVAAQITAAPPGQRCEVMIVRGSEAHASHSDAPQDPQPGAQQGAGRDWLAQTLQAAGASVRWVVSYQRGLPLWQDAQQQLARHASADGSVWCFSSSQAIVFLQTLMPALRWSQARCLVTHPRIAQAARAAGFGEIALSRPLVADVVASLESMA